MPKFFLLILILFLQSCNSLEGGLHSFRPFSLIDENNEEVRISPGLTPATLYLKSKTKFSIETEGHSFIFQSSEGREIPHEDGEWHLSAIQHGQKFGVYAKVNSKVLKGELIRDQESCSWVERYFDCDNKTNSCRTRYRTLFGTRDVSYRNNTHKKTVALHLYMDETGEIIAQLLGEKKLVKKVYRYESDCY